MVSQSDDQRRVPGKLVQPDVAEGKTHQQDVLGRDAREELGKVVGVAAVGRHEHPDDPCRVDLLTGPGLESQATAGQDDLASGLVQCKDEVVVEDAQQLHFRPVSRRWT